MMLAGRRCAPCRSPLMSRSPGSGQLTPRSSNPAPALPSRAAAQISGSPSRGWRCRAQSPAGEGGDAGPRGDRDHAPAIDGLVRKGWRVTAPIPPTPCSTQRPRARTTRRCACTRPGADPAEGAALRKRRQRHARGLPLVRTAPDHGPRSTSPGQDRADPRDGRRDPHGGRCAAHRAARAFRPACEPAAAARGHRAHGLQASKALGQNFILDRQLLARIAAVPGSLDGASVYEVGPGPGGLTRALLEAGQSRRGRTRPPLPACPGGTRAGYPARLRVMRPTR
jgi:hypothetical protein